MNAFSQGFMVAVVEGGKPYIRINFETVELMHSAHNELLAARATHNSPGDKARDLADRLKRIQHLGLGEEVTAAILQDVEALAALASLPQEPASQEAGLTIEQIALEECLQLGYTVEDGRLCPPESNEWHALAASRLEAKGLHHG